MRLIYMVLLFVIVGNSYAQNRQGYRFIEPNLSLSYDNNLLQVTDSFSNAVQGTEGYGFLIATPGRTRSYVQVNAATGIVKPGKAAEDSLFKALVAQINRYAGDSIIVQSRKFISYKDFTGLGYVAFHKRSKSYSVAFSGVRFLEEGLCKVYYTSTGKDSSGNHYELFTSIIDGIQTYSKKDIPTVSCSVVVDSIGTNTYMVHTKEKVTIHSVKMDYESFFPDYRGYVIFPCDSGKKAELIVLNSIGKKVAIPFTVTNK